MMQTLSFRRLALAGGAPRDRAPLALERSRDEAAESIPQRRPGRLALGLGRQFLSDAPAALALLANLERVAERARRLGVPEPLRVQGELLGPLLQDRLLAPAAAQDGRRARLGDDCAGLREPTRDGLLYFEPQLRDQCALSLPPIIGVESRDM